MRNIGYCSYASNSVIFDFDTNTFDIYLKNDKKCLEKGRVTKLFYKDLVIDAAEYQKSSHSNSFSRYAASTLTVTYTRDAEALPCFSITFEVSFDGISVEFYADAEARAEITGRLFWGGNMQEDTFPMSSKSTSSHLRAGIGHAASKMDNMLFDRATDSALFFEGGKECRVQYDYAAQLYDLTVHTGILLAEHKFTLSFAENILAKAYHFDYGKINKNGIFKSPPSGFMTWYSVGFGACEENVLANARWQAENLKKYGANTIWVDWEWYHPDYTGKTGDDVNSLSPDKSKYPNGLGYVAEEIKKLGLVPALWVGFTHDTSENAYIQEHPEIVLAKADSWCGSYFYDFSHPKYIDEFIPIAFETVKKWGYEAIKYDTIMDGMVMQERFRSSAFDITKTTKALFRDMVKKARECMGDDCYMLACGPFHAGILYAGDIFDAARVGADIFAWKEYIEEGIETTMHYYPLHNNVLYCDPDNTILSAKYNTFSQAASRIYFAAMLGLPLTFGDVFSELEEEKIALIKKCLPPLDIHPMDIHSSTSNKRFLFINLTVSMPCEDYNVVSMFNFLDKKGQYTLQLEGDLHLDKGEYHIYDFTKEEYLGLSDSKIPLSLEAFETRILAVRKKLNRPQILSTSRHITQGAAEIEQMSWSEKDTALTIRAKLVEGDLYKITLFLPQGYLPESEDIEPVSGKCGVYEYSLLPSENKSQEIYLKFKNGSC